MEYRVLRGQIITSFILSIEPNDSSIALARAGEGAPDLAAGARVVQNMAWL